MKRYLLFVGDHYYPEPGWLDCKGYSDDTEELKEIGRHLIVTGTYDDEKLERWEMGKADWAHIVDLEEGRIVLVFNRDTNDWKCPTNEDEI